MHNKISALLGLSSILVVSNAFAQEREEYQTACPMAMRYLKPPCEYFKLEGTIGQSHVAMSLTECQDGLVGLYYYTQYLTPLHLTGKKTKSGVIELIEKSAENETGTISGSLVDGDFVGQWIGPNGRKPLDVSLKRRIGDMCDLKGPVKSFSDPRWPITFDYPASLHLSVDGHRIQLECLDPAAMQYSSNAISITKSKPGSLDFDYLKCGSRWYFKESLPKCDADAPTSEPAEVSSRHGLTVLKGRPQEFRLYCSDGGYFGQTYGETAGIVLKKAWINVYAQSDLADVVPAIIESMRPISSTGNQASKRANPRQQPD
jgi:hypothetical protein